MNVFAEINVKNSSMQSNVAYLETNLYSPFYWNPQRCKFDSKECKWRGIFHHLYRSFKHSIHTFCKDYFGKQWFFVNIKLLKISLKHLDNNNRLELVCIWDNSCAIKFFYYKIKYTAIKYLPKKGQYLYMRKRKSTTTFIKGKNMYNTNLFYNHNNATWRFEWNLISEKNLKLKDA